MIPHIFEMEVDQISIKQRNIKERKTSCGKDKRQRVTEIPLWSRGRVDGSQSEELWFDPRVRRKLLTIS